MIGSSSSEYGCHEKSEGNQKKKKKKKKEIRNLVHQGKRIHFKEQVEIRGAGESEGATPALGRLVVELETADGGVPTPRLEGDGKH